VQRREKSEAGNQQSLCLYNAHLSHTEGISLANIWVSADVSPSSWVKSWRIGMAGVEKMLFKLKKPTQTACKAVSFHYQSKKKANNTFMYAVLSDVF